MILIHLYCIHRSFILFVLTAASSFSSSTREMTLKAFNGNSTQLSSDQPESICIKDLAESCAVSGACSQCAYACVSAGYSYYCCYQGQCCCYIAPSVCSVIAQCPLNDCA